MIRLSRYASLIFFSLVASSGWLYAQLALAGGNPTLSITTGMAGAEPLAVVNTATSIDYEKSASVQKITVLTSCLGQSFTLKVVATGASFGTPAPEVTLTQGMLATDLITNIPKRPPGPNKGSCTLLYTASATFAQGNSSEQGNDVHTVTYTILAQ